MEIGRAKIEGQSVAYGAFLFAQSEQVMGDIQRIFYVHLPLAWVGFVAFGHACWGGVRYLGTGRRDWDIVSASAAEIGVLFATLVIVTGSLWARPVWGTWWTWDPQLVTYLILWFIYVGYLMLRGAAGAGRAGGTASGRQRRCRNPAPSKRFQGRGRKRSSLLLLPHSRPRNIPKRRTTPPHRSPDLQSAP